MKYSDDKDLFSKTLLGKLSPLDSDYAFFVADLLDSLSQNIKVNILPHSPFGNGFTDNIEDLILEGDALEMIFRTHENYKLVLSKKEISQVASAKYYVNCDRIKQKINIRFIR